MKPSSQELTTLHREVAELKREVVELTRLRDELYADDEAGNVYVLDDDDDQARAFDAFYQAYDEVHVKTRKFLLG